MDQPGKVANPARGQLNRENVRTLRTLMIDGAARESERCVIPVQQYTNQFK